MNDTVRDAQTPIEEDSQINTPIQYMSDEEIARISDQLIQQYHDVYEVLAK